MARRTPPPTPYRPPPPAPAGASPATVKRYYAELAQIREQVHRENLRRIAEQEREKANLEREERRHALEQERADLRQQRALAAAETVRAAQAQMEKVEYRNLSRNLPEDFARAAASLLADKESATQRLAGRQILYEPPRPPLYSFAGPAPGPGGIGEKSPYPTTPPVQIPQLKAPELVTKASDFRNILGKMSDGVGAAAMAFQKLTPVIGLARQRFGMLMDFVGSASPNARATFEGSEKLFKARVGRDFVGESQGLSLGVQKASSFYQSLPDWMRKAFVTTQTGGTGGTISKLFGGEQPLRSMEGLPRSRSMSDEQFSQELGGAGLTANSLEGEILREQLKSLKDMGALLQNIDRNTQPQSGIFTGGGRL